MSHFLNVKYLPEKQTPSWDRSIREQRTQLALVLNDSPSLRAQLPELLADNYEWARIDAVNETGLNLEVFPETCKWTVAEVLR